MTAGKSRSIENVAPPSQARTYVVRGQIDEDFASRQAGVLLGVIAGALWLFIPR